MNKASKTKKVLLILSGRFCLVLIAGIAAVLISVLVSGDLREGILEKVIAYRVKENQAHIPLAGEGKIRVFLCGTGSPQAGATRNQPCTVIVAAGKVFVFDAGENAMRGIETSKIPLSAVSKIFITHWHSDHFSGLGSLINNSWINGRKEPFDVYGPKGVKDIVTSLARGYDLDADYRRANGVPSNKDLAFAVPHAVSTPKPGQSTLVYDEDGVRISAFKMDHYPVDPALGYLFAFRGKKIFISGDTKVTDGYLPALHNADMVIHEAVNSHLINRAAAVMRKMGNTLQADHTKKILTYHSDTLMLAKQAQDSGVKHLVLTHLIPEPCGFFSELLFSSGMDNFYHGTITVSRDNMALILDADI